MADRIFYILMHWICLLIFAPLILGLIAKVKALMGGRIGPPLGQMYFDTLKLVRKQSIYSKTTTWVFQMGPLVVLACVLIVSLFIPMGVLEAPVHFEGDVVLAVSILALARFFLIAAAFDTGFSMEAIGASREAFFSCLAELTIFMNLITLAILSHSLSLSKMIGDYSPVSWHLLGPSLILIVASFFLVLLAETGRIPIDDSDTHLELTMIHEVMILDHSGVDLAYLQYAAAGKLLFFLCILIPILLPFKGGNYIFDSFVFLVALAGMAVVIGVVESAMARLKINRVANFLLIAFSLAFFGFIVTVWRG